MWMDCILERLHTHENNRAWFLKWEAMKQEEMTEWLAAQQVLIKEALQDARQESEGVNNLALEQWNAGQAVAWRMPCANPSRADGWQSPVE